MALLIFFSPLNLSLLWGESISVDRSRLESISDNTPLVRSDDRPGWLYLFEVLAEHSQAELDQNVFAEVGFFELDRQPVEYRGRIVRVSGRMKRCQFFPDPSIASGGYYECWVQLKDHLRHPISVCVMELPKDSPVQDEMDQEVTIIGFSYKRRLFLSASGEEVCSPTLLAKTFRWTSLPRSDPPLEPEKSSSHLIPTILLLVVLWFTLRLLNVFINRRSRRKPIRFGSTRTSAPESVHLDATQSPDEDEHPTVSLTGEETQIVQKDDSGAAGTAGMILLLLASLLSAQTGVASEPVDLSVPEISSESQPSNKSKPASTQGIDAEFTRTMLKMDVIAWDTLGSEEIPLEQQWEPVLAMIDQLRHSVPESFLKANVTDTFLPEKSDLPSTQWVLPLAKDPAQYRGKAFRLRGLLKRIVRIELNPAQREAYEIPCVYRCILEIPGQGEARVLVGTAPSTLPLDEPINERAAVTGIYIKRLQRDDINESESLPAESVFLPLLVAPRLEWFPRTFLGDLGMDVGLFEQVPALRIADLKETQFSALPASLELLSRNEIIRRAFKFTESDRVPFYRLLQVTSLTPAGRIEYEARERLKSEGKDKFSSVELFNHPRESRGQPVLFYGRAKRVLPTLVEDKEVQALYGIDRYYQIYFYTDDSQGNPLIACVTSLPEGMPTGASSDYNEQIAVAGFPYKLWIYDSSAPSDKGDSNKPAYAPLLLGRSVTWFPKSQPVKAPWGAQFSQNTKTTITAVFLVSIFILWFFLRRLKKRKITA